MQASGSSTRPSRNPISRWFRDRRVGVKIGIAVGACVAFMAIQGVHDLTRVTQLSEAADGLYKDAQTLTAVGDARVAAQRTRARTLRIVLAPVAQQPPMLEELKEIDTKFDAAVASLRSLKTIPSADIEAYAANVAAFRQLRDNSLVPAASRGITFKAAQPLLLEGDKIFAEILKTGAGLGNTARGSLVAQGTAAPSAEPGSWTRRLTDTGSGVTWNSRRDRRPTRPGVVSVRSLRTQQRAESQCQVTTP